MTIYHDTDAPAYRLSSDFLGTSWEQTQIRFMSEGENSSCLIIVFGNRNFSPRGDRISLLDTHCVSSPVCENQLQARAGSSAEAGRAVEGASRRARGRAALQAWGEELPGLQLHVVTRVHDE